MARPSPIKVVTQNVQDAQGGTDQRSSGWVVGIVRFLQPSSLADDDSFPSSLSIVQNDAVSVSINNEKNSFGKMCSISLKSTDFWYPGSVSPGDWVVVWMNNNEADLNRIIRLLQQVRVGRSVGALLCDQDSGLKFCGRVTAVNHTDTVNANGPRTITQNISAQAFIEFATSVYYTASIRAFTSGPVTPPGGTGVSTASELQSIKAAVESAQFSGLDATLKRLAEKYRDFYARGNGEFTPDVLVGLFFIIVMGIDRDTGFVNDLPVKGSFNDGIFVPNTIARIFNRPRATKIWQIMNVYLGLQDYTVQGTNPWYESFSPTLESTDVGVFRRTPIRTKGFVPFAPALWDNVSMWSILNNYLNPVCNEMYTSLRIDETGNIHPTLTVREKPFSTGLFNVLEDNAVGKGGGVQRDVDIPNEDEGGKNLSIEQTQTSANESGTFRSLLNVEGLKTAARASRFFSSATASLGARTLFGKLPRWIIDESVVRSFTYASNEAARVNFVQVWGRNAGAEFTASTLNQDRFRLQQFTNGNFYVDQRDISRNGLRAYIVTSPYDVYFEPGTPGFAKVWAKLNADWLFNGHLKANGTIIMNGVKDPIVEGDNVEYRGILFHIEGVTHNGVLNADGRKTWTTTLNVSNGMIASSLDNPNGVPQYPAHQNRKRQQLRYPFAPGLTEVQNREGDETKNSLGDSIARAREFLD